MLEEKIETVIHDLAWEKVLDKIKQTKSYKHLKDEKKRDYLKRLSIKFKNQITYDKGKNALTNYEDDIKEIYKTYKKIYNNILNTSIFYKQIVKNKKTYKELIEQNIKTTQALFKNFE